MRPISDYEPIPLPAKFKHVGRYAELRQAVASLPEGQCIPLVAPVGVKLGTFARRIQGSLRGKNLPKVSIFVDRENNRLLITKREVR